MEFQVLGEGPKDCKICFIGEAPGAEEASKGRPFVGASGKELDGLLANSGILRSECYLTNVVKVRPYNNDYTTFLKISKGIGKPQSNDYPLYEQYLWEELRGIKCNVFVPLGGNALYALTRLTGIMNWRGSILHGVDEIENRKVIPTVHPAAALRNAIFKYHIRRDLDRIKTQGEFPEVILPNRMLRIEPDFEECMTYLGEIEDITAFDIEVSGYELSCLCFSKSPWDVMCVPFRGGMGNYWHEDQEKTLMKEVERILLDNDITKIIHNSSFDCTFMYEKYGILIKNYEDTFIAHAILWAQFPKSLAFVSSMFTEEPFYKDEGKESNFGLKTGFKEFWLYNAKDGAVTHEIWEPLRSRLVEYKNWDAYKRQLATVDPLIYMQVRGLRFDSTAVSKATVKIEGEIDELKIKAANQISNRRTQLKLKNPKLPETFYSSPKQKQDYFYGELKIPADRNKDTGKPTIDLRALRKLQKKGYEEAGTLSQISQKNKLRSSYLKVDLDPDLRLRGSWNPVGTGPGRFSVSMLWRGTFYGIKEYVGLNLQTLPEDFKPYVYADEGCLLINVDLAQADNRVVAWVGNVPAMKKAFIDGVDVHKLTASKLFYIPFDEVSDVPGSSPLGDGTKSQRFWGKQSNHAFNYGRGPYQFAKDFDMLASEGKELRAGYFRIYPEVETRYQAMITAEVRTNRTVTDPYGKSCKFLGWLSDELLRAAYSFIPQSVVANKVNQSILIPVCNDKDFYLLEVLLQVHDSCLLQASLSSPIDELKNQLGRIIEMLEEPVPFDEPFVIPADIQIGLNYQKASRLNPNGMREIELENLEEEIENLKASAQFSHRKDHSVQVERS